MEPWEQREADRQLLELSTTQPLPATQKPSSTTQWFSLKQSTAQLRGEQYVVRELLEMVLFVILLFFLVQSRQFGTQLFGIRHAQNPQSTKAQG